MNEFSSHNGLTRQQLEARRLLAAPLFAAGARRSSVARRLGVSRTTAGRWARRYAADDMRARKATGRPRRLTPAQRGELLAPYERLGRPVFRRFAEVIEEGYGVHFHADHVGRILHDLGLEELPRGRH